LIQDGGQRHGADHVFQKGRGLTHTQTSTAGPPCCLYPSTAP